MGAVMAGGSGHLASGVEPRAWRAGAVAWPVIGMTLVTALGAQVSVHLPFTPVPLTGQVFGVLLSGLLLSPGGAVVAQAGYLAGARLGLPWLAGGLPWTGTLVTAGYLAGFPLAAWAVAWLRKRLGPGWACLAGIGVVHALGVAWLAVASGRSMPEALLLGSLPFWPGDVAKALLAIRVARKWSAGPSGEGT